VAYLILSGSLEKKKVDKLSFYDKSSIIQQRFAGDIAGAGIVMRELVGISNLEDEADWYCGTETSARVAVFGLEQAKFRELSSTVLTRLMIAMGEMTMHKLLETLQVEAARSMRRAVGPDGRKLTRVSRRDVQLDVMNSLAESHRQKSIMQPETQQQQGLNSGEDLSRQMTRGTKKNALRDIELSVLMKAVSASSRFWYGFTDHELHMLSESMTLVEVPKGEYICKVGEQSDFAGLVIQGSVNVINADDVVLATMYVGDGIAQSAFFQEGGTGALGVVSMDADTLVAKIKLEDIELLKDRFPVVRTRERVAVRDRGRGREGRGVSPCQTLVRFATFSPL
jgi:CRP/FNR family cyclic AMP-dependent transcriptional regulator